MEEIEFIFQTSALDKPTLLPQISKALEKRLEIRAGQMRPNSKAAVPMTEEEKQRQSKRRKLQGILMMAVGVLAAVAGFVVDGRSILLIVLGAIALFYGFLTFRTASALTSDPDKYDKAAQDFLDSRDESVQGKNVQVCFSGEEMITVMGELDDLDQEAVAFDQIEMILETRDVFLVIYDRRGVVLQKSELDPEMGSVDEFRDFIKAHVKTFAFVPEAN